ncbi:hypothetical protein BOX15_Mlig025757g2, partial [Macrostomum lignano]
YRANSSVKLAVLGAASASGSRGIHVSAALCRIPHFHRKRYRRTLVPPYHQARYADEDLTASEEPPLPLDGSLFTTRPSPEQERRESMLKQRSIYGKLNELNETESNMWYRKLNMPLEHPCCLPLAQAICNANIDPWLIPSAPKVPESAPSSTSPPGTKIDSEEADKGDVGSTPTSAVSAPPIVVASPTSRLSLDQRSSLISLAIEAVRAVEAQHRWPEQPGPRLQARVQQRRICAVMEALLIGCARTGALTAPDDLQADESPFVQMFARYSGLHPSASKRLLLPDLAFMRTGRFLIRAPLAWQLRSRTPLSPLASSLSVRPPPPDWPYNPDLLGLTPEQDYWCFGEIAKFLLKRHGDKVLRAVPGHVTDDARLPGDPCEFGLLLAINGDDPGGVDRQPDQSPPVDFQRPEFWPALTCDALLRLYASTAAQAFHRGFNWVTDLRLGDRPFITMSGSFVGDYLKLSAFQLATVAGGGDYQMVSDSAGQARLSNQMWTQPEPVLLWQRDSRTGRVTDANPEQVLRLADLICSPRCSREEAAEGRPFLDGEAPCSRTRWIGSAEETVYRPVEPLSVHIRQKPRSPNYMYLLDPVQPHTLYRSLAGTHPRFPRLPEAAEARAADWRSKRKFVKRGRRKVVRKPYLITDAFP